MEQKGAGAGNDCTICGDRLYLFLVIFFVSNALMLGLQLEMNSGELLQQ